MERPMPEPAPVMTLDDGDYIVHAACGLAGEAKQITVSGAAPQAQKLVMNAGGLKISGVLNDPSKRRMAAQLFGQAYMAAHLLVLHNKEATERVAETVIDSFNSS